MMTGGGDSSGVKEQAHECGCAVFCVCSLRKRAGLPSVTATNWPSSHISDKYVQTQTAGSRSCFSLFMVRNE